MYARWRAILQELLPRIKDVLVILARCVAEQMAHTILNLDWCWVGRTASGVGIFLTICDKRLISKPHDCRFRQIVHLTQRNPGTIMHSLQTTHAQFPARPERTSSEMDRTHLENRLDKCVVRSLPHCRVPGHCCGQCGAHYKELSSRNIGRTRSMG